MSAASFLLAACLLIAAVSSAESVKVHLFDVKADASFLEAWYQVPPDAQPTDRIALYPQDIAGNISNIDPIRYVFVPNSLESANSKATAQ